MRKDIFLPAFALAGGVAGFLLRLWQWSSAYDPASELLNASAPASVSLVALSVLMGILAAALGRGGASLAPPEKAFFCPSPGYMTLMTAGGMCFFLAAAVGIPEFFQQYLAWKNNPQYYMLPIAFLLAILCCLLGAAGALIAGRNNYRGISGPTTRAPATLTATGGISELQPQRQHKKGQGDHGEHIGNFFTHHLRLDQ